MIIKGKGSPQILVVLGTIKVPFVFDKSISFVTYRTLLSFSNYCLSLYIISLYNIIGCQSVVAMLRAIAVEAMLRATPVVAMLRATAVKAMLRATPVEAMLRAAPVEAMLRAAAV